MDDNLLSDREIEVLQLVGQGKSNKEIAVELDISVNTVKVHIGKIFQKTNVTSRTEATLFAIQHGIIKSPTSKSESPESAQNADVAPSAMEGGKSKPTSLFRNRWLLIGLGLLVLVGLSILIAKPSFLWPSEPSVDIPQQKWESLAPLSAARSGVAVATFEEKIIIIGGHSSAGVMDTVEMYDPATDTWTPMNSKPTAVYDASAALIGEKVYVPGGLTSSGAPTKTVEVFNPRKNSWEKCADLPVALNGYGLVSYEGQLYLFGGRDSTKPLNLVLRYDPFTDTWHQASPMPTARFNVSVLADNGKIYVMGGSNGKGNLSANESFSPYKQLENEDPWLVEPSLPEKLSGYAAIKLYDKIAIIGGKSTVSGAIDQFHYNAAQEDWQIVNINPESANTITEAAFILLGQNIYMIGGTVNSTFLDSVTSYQAMFTILLPLTIN